MSFIGKVEPVPVEGRKRTFRMVPDALFTHPETQPQDLMTWCYLNLHARHRGVVQVTDRRLAEDMGVVEMTVRRSLSRLEKMGFIARERRGQERLIALQAEGEGEAPGMRLKLVAGL